MMTQTLTSKQDSRLNWPLKLWYRVYRVDVGTIENSLAASGGVGAGAPVFSRSAHESLGGGGAQFLSGFRRSQASELFGLGLWRWRERGDR